MWISTRSLRGVSCSGRNWAIPSGIDRYSIVRISIFLNRIGNLGIGLVLCTALSFVEGWMRSSVGHLRRGVHLT
jgi:hypothetical protein